MGTTGPASFLAVLKLALCVVVGSTFVTLVIHGGIVVRLLAWLPPLPFFRGIPDAIMAGFSTSSSTATLPVAIRVAERNLGVSSPVPRPAEHTCALQSLLRRSYAVLSRKNTRMNHSYK